ncbi:MAG: hypothetical protein ACYDCL_17750 [Myxococcales bacterium]
MAPACYPFGGRPAAPPIHPPGSRRAIRRHSNASCTTSWLLHAGSEELLLDDNRRFAELACAAAQRGGGGSAKLAEMVPFHALLLAGLAVLQVRLHEVRGQGAERCPGEVALRDAVAARLGRDPFSASAPAELTVLFESAGAGLVTTVLLSGRQRRLTSPVADCQELAAATATAVAIAIDSLDRQQTAVTVVRSAPAPPPPPPPPTPLHLWVLAGGLAAAGSAPGPNAGLALGLDVRWPRWSLGLEGRADLPAGLSAGGGTISTSLLFATLVPCYRVWHLGGCALVGAGAEQAQSAGLSGATGHATPFAAAGGRLFGEIPLGGRCAVRLQGDLLAPFTKTTYLVNDQPAWVTPSLAFALGGALAARLY